MQKHDHKLINACLSAVVRTALAIRSGSTEKNAGVSDSPPRSSIAPIGAALPLPCWLSWRAAARPTLVWRERPRLRRRPHQRQETRDIGEVIRDPPVASKPALARLGQRILRREWSLAKSENRFSDCWAT